MSHQSTSHCSTFDWITFDIIRFVWHDKMQNHITVSLLTIPCTANHLHMEQMNLCMWANHDTRPCQRSSICIFHCDSVAQHFGWLSSQPLRQLNKQFLPAHLVKQERLQVSLTPLSPHRHDAGLENSESNRYTLCAANLVNCKFRTDLSNTKQIN